MRDIFWECLSEEKVLIGMKNTFIIFFLNMPYEMWLIKIHKNKSGDFEVGLISKIIYD